MLSILQTSEEVLKSIQRQNGEISLPLSIIEDFKDLLKLDISFYSNNSIPYCLYCYDNQMNYDEVGIDCGGSCLECIEKFEFIDWLYYVIIILWIVLILLFFAYTLLEDKVKKKIKSFIRKS